MSIEIQRLTHVYQPETPWQVVALRDVSLRIASGEAVALIGPTGSGKSTLAQHMAGLLKPASGHVRIHGHNPWEPGVDKRQVRLLVGMIFQYPEQQLFESTVRADVSFGPRNLGWDPALVEARVATALAMVGLGHEILDRSPFELSSGQMRRVALAGVLAMNPKVLIADEPTSGLDPSGRRWLLGLLGELNRRQGITLVLVTHDMDEVAQLVDRIIVLDQGSVVMDGPAREVYSHPHRLRSLGLDIPTPTRVAQHLADRGWQIARDILTVDQAAQAIIAAMGAAPVQEAGPPA